MSEITEQNWAIALAQQMQGGEHASDPLFNPLVYRHQWVAAEQFSKSKLVPEHFRGDAASCYVAITMALSRGEDPIMFMQNVFMVGGTPGFKAEYLIARCRQRGLDLRWKVETLLPTEVTVPQHTTQKVTLPAAQQPNVRITCYVHGDDDPDRRVSLESSDAIRAGWYRNGSGQYHHSLPRMLRWRTATWWVSLFAAELKHGLSVVEELEDDRRIELVSVDPPAPQRGADAVLSALASPPAPVAPVTPPSHGERTQEPAAPTPGTGTPGGPAPEGGDSAERAELIAEYLRIKDSIAEPWLKQARIDHGLQKIRKEQADVGKLRDLNSEIRRLSAERAALSVAVSDENWTGPKDLSGLKDAIELCRQDEIIDEAKFARALYWGEIPQVDGAPELALRKVLHHLLGLLPSEDDPNSPAAPAADDDLPEEV